MRKPITITALSMLLAVALLLPAGLVSGQVGPGALKYCEEFAFSTEEDFVTNGPKPSDGIPIISDGDLLGPGCTVCARNQDLLAQTFDVTQDLGLDAADVIDVERYLVAFSTELDSPHGSQFTAGDLLVTNGLIIPNIALTYRFGVSYDIGLDVVHFVGNLDSILAFLDEARQTSRDEWLAKPDSLASMLTRRSIDIWFSIEGTWMPAGAAAILDGDLLSARDGIIVVGNDSLLPPAVPAGIPNRGVDFGLDAATTNRAGDKEQIHFSTEILYKGEPSFTDGDILEIGDGVAAKNWDLVRCFEPKARDLGLDALSVSFPVTRPCESRITHIADVSVADIGSDGMAMTGTVDAILAPVPFGGMIDIQGSICDDVEEFRVLYHLNGSANPWTPIPVLASQDWKVKTDAFFPPGPDCLDQQNWSSADANGWYDAADYRHLTSPALGGCNPGLSLTVWDSPHILVGLGGPDALYEVALETKTTSGVFTDTAHLVQLDNMAPTAELNKTPDTCDIYTDMPITITGRISDAHFYRYDLRLTGDGYGIHYYPSISYYDDPGDDIIETGTKNWAAFVDLGAVDVHDLDPSPVECGYTVYLRAWERTLWCNFSFPNNQAYHWPGHRQDVDAWTFKYQP